MVVRGRHPLADRPLVDWDLILIMEPLTIGGALAGSFLNKVSGSCRCWRFSMLLLMAEEEEEEADEEEADEEEGESDDDHEEEEKGSC